MDLREENEKKTFPSYSLFPYFFQNPFVLRGSTLRVFRICFQNPVFFTFSESVLFLFIRFQKFLPD
jgi:hypothetical protein